MHRIDTNGHVANMFDGGDPAVPRLPTQLDTHFMNAVQEEIMKFLTDAAIAPIKGTWTQLRSAITALYVDKATVQTMTAQKTIAIAAGAVAAFVITHAGTGGGISAAVANAAAGAFGNSGSNATVSAQNAGAGPALRLESGTGPEIHLVGVGADPAAPNDGDVWFNTAAGALKIRIGGVTKTVTVT